VPPAAALPTPTSVPRRCPVTTLRVRQDPPHRHWRFEDLHPQPELRLALPLWQLLGQILPN